MPNKRTTRARTLRQTPTKSEGLLWNLLRSKQLCDLKFRRQHPIAEWYADFACPSEKLVVEIDGDYHEQVIDDDLKRQQHFEALGWRVIRFTSEQVEEDAEAVGRAITAELGREYVFRRRKRTGVRNEERERRKAEKTNKAEVANPPLA